ncbi:MAG: hypothetical protein K8S14_03965 [Actinomycetia bacterium]|nr:hypothetical protein [Actinomycetes bacterium]
MESKYDTIISGAGPSGSFPRHKICAGGLQHRALALIPFDVGKVLQKSFSGSRSQTAGLF